MKNKSQTSSSEEQYLLEQLVPIWKKYRLTDVYVFGSYARRTQTPKSDIDLLICPPTGFSLLDLAALHLEIEHTLHKKVDITTPKSLSTFLRPFIEEDKRLIYSANNMMY